MTRSSLGGRALAVLLAAVAGFVDAVGFLHVGGLFVSFMTGNSTRLAVGLARGTPEAALAAGLIAAFVLGVVLGSLAGHAAGTRRRPAVLLLVAFGLAGASALGRLSASWPAAILMTMSMGATNATVERDGDLPFGVTYMTGTLAKVGQRLALALRGGDPLGWVPYLALWLGLMAGAIGGALAYGRSGPDVLWAAALAIAVLAAATALRELRRR